MNTIHISNPVLKISQVFFQKLSAYIKLFNIQLIGTWDGRNFN